MQPNKHSELIKAWADGAEIQFRPNRDYIWVECSIPTWEDEYEYRVKPKVTHKIGRKYNKSGSVYLLASVGKCLVNLIDIETGYRWSENAEVSDVNFITEEEFTLVCNCGKFELIDD